MHRGKYRGNRDALIAIATVAAPRLTTTEWDAVHAVVPVPLGTRRLRQRGYNQADLIAGVIARAQGVPLVRGLERTRDTAPQAERDEAQRRRNVEGAFEWRGQQLDGAKVWLVDDVLTTGATVAAAAHSLFANGAESVRAVVIAAVP